MGVTTPAVQPGTAAYRQHLELRAAGVSRPLTPAPAGTRLFSRAAIFLGCVASTVLLALAFASTMHRSGGHANPAFLARLDAIADAFDLGLDQVEVTGYRFTSEGDILDAVDLPNVQTFLTFDSAAVKARIERLPWVASASVERVLPNRLLISVSERKPYAVWRRGAQDVLFDATGRELATIAQGAAKELPLVTGEHAVEDAKRLLDLVARYPDVARHLAWAERISGRRWRLVLDKGRRIELPAESDAAALAMLVEMRPGGRLIDIEASVIDLTVVRRPAIRGLSKANRA